MDRTSTPEDTVGAVRSVVQKQTVAFGFGHAESPGVQAILRSSSSARTPLVHTQTHTHARVSNSAAPTEEPFVPDQVHFSIVINCNPQPIHPRSTRTRTRMRARAHTHTETALNE